MDNLNENLESVVRGFTLGHDDYDFCNNYVRESFVERVLEVYPIERFVYNSDSFNSYKLLWQFVVPFFDILDYVSRLELREIVYYVNDCSLTGKRTIFVPWFLRRRNSNGIHYCNYATLMEQLVTISFISRCLQLHPYCEWEKMCDDASHLKSVAERQSSIKKIIESRVKHEVLDGYHSNKATRFEKMSKEIKDFIYE